MLIDGEEPATDACIDVRSPYDGHLVGTVAEASVHEIDLAVAAAGEVHRLGPPPSHARAAILDRAAAHLEQRADEFARLISEEAAKPITTARAEVDRAIETTRASAAVARTLRTELLPVDASPAGTGMQAFLRRLPVGVVAAITPFNFPLNLVCHKVMPAIAAGCPVVVKPAVTTPLTALALARLLIHDCGAPTAMVQVVPCDVPTAGHLVGHPDVAMVSFTGSPAVGWRIRRQVPQKKVSLELGNNSPVIIEPDADWASAAEAIRTAGYSFSGQSCISTQRIYVHRSVAAAFVEALVDHVKGLRLGDPADAATDMSSLITEAATTRVTSWIEEAVTARARLATGGQVRSDGVLEPTVLLDVTPEMRVCADEVFGPVVAVATYDTLDEALALANDTRYGLQAAIFTSNVSTAFRAIDDLDYGGVLVNEMPTWRADHLPYGGRRDSGNAREGPASVAREMSEERLAVIRYQ